MADRLPAGMHHGSCLHAGRRGRRPLRKGCSAFRFIGRTANLPQPPASFLGSPLKGGTRGAAHTPFFSGKDKAGLKPRWTFDSVRRGDPCGRPYERAGECPQNMRRFTAVCRSTGRIGCPPPEPCRSRGRSGRWVRALAWACGSPAGGTAPRPPVPPAESPRPTA